MIPTFQTFQMIQTWTKPYSKHGTNLIQTWLKPDSNLIQTLFKTWFKLNSNLIQPVRSGDLYNDIVQVDSRKHETLQLQVS